MPRHVCEAVLIYRQSSFPSIENAILACRHGMVLLTSICVEWMIRNFELIKDDTRMHELPRDTFVRVASGAFDRLKDTVELQEEDGTPRRRMDRASSSGSSARERALMLRRTSTSYDNPLYATSRDVGHVRALYRLKVRERHVSAVRMCLFTYAMHAIYFLSFVALTSFSESRKFLHVHILASLFGYSCIYVYMYVCVCVCLKCG